MVLGAGSLVPKLYILRGGSVQVSHTLQGPHGPQAKQEAAMSEAGGFSYFGENVLEVSGGGTRHPGARAAVSGFITAVGPKSCACYVGACGPPPLYKAPSLSCRPIHNNHPGACCGEGCPALGGPRPMLPQLTARHQHAPAEGEWGIRLTLNLTLNPKRGS